jgi:hypothetical protein
MKLVIGRVKEAHFSTPNPEKQPPTFKSELEAVEFIHKHLNGRVREWKGDRVAIIYYPSWRQRLANIRAHFKKENRKPLMEVGGKKSKAERKLKKFGYKP